jgi:hypothetical protein
MAGLLQTLRINRQEQGLITNVLDSLKVLINYDDCAALLDEMNGSQ